IKDPADIDAAAAAVVCTFGAVSQNLGGNGGQTVTPAKDVPEPTTDDWLYVKGNKIVDSKGREVWMTGVNWFGYNTGTNTFDGLWACDLNTSVNAIADHGFNLLRIPFSAELINKWAAGEYPEANYNHAYNSYLNDMNSLEIFDYVVGQCRANGLKIMIDIHSAKTDSMGHMKNMWYEGDVSAEDYRDALAWMAERYKDDDTIIAFDLKNEPHGKANESPRAKWDGSKDEDNWKYQAELAADAVLSANPNVLIMVEGIEIYPRDIKSNGDFSSKDPSDYLSTWWGGNLRGVKNDPVDLGKYNNKLVYSPHDYGPAVYQQEWFKGKYTYESLKEDAWNDNWLYIHDSGTAPILIGEWGGFMTEPNLTWMKYLRQLIGEKHLNHTFWCFNANSGDTGGLVRDDFVTWDEEKYSFVKEVLWQEDGKFVGLDHQIPLGENGKALG
ncbi:MAG: glycoside hydrolase family 5 protein, partial [Oscillospiraceae bacterium]|nr:glycoside hydrolase family 5 protein [Oscillospiraceae bacterium]